MRAFAVRSGQLVGLICLMTLFASRFDSQILEQGSSIEGVVTDLGSGAPIFDAEVRLASPLLPTTRVVRSGPDGRFAFNNLVPGRYRIDSRRTGFTAAPGRNSPFFLKALTVGGDQVVDVRLGLIRAGTVSGHVEDGDGVGLQGMAVTLNRPGYDIWGDRVLETLSGLATETDSDGEFRIENVEPGEYYVRAAREGLYPRYYPRATSLDSAVPLTVLPGLDVGGLRLSVAETPLYRTRIRLTSDEGPITNARIVLMERTRMRTPWSEVKVDVADDGTLLLSPLPPGAYELTFHYQGDESPQTLSVHTIELDVVDEDVNLGTVMMRPFVDIRGVILASGPEPESGDPLLARVNLRADPSYGGTSDVYGRIGPDGNFVLSDVREGRYGVYGFTRPGYYIRSIRYGSEEVLYDGLTVAGNPPGPLEVFLDGPAGAIQGFVVDADEQPVGQAVVVLDPGPGRRKVLDVEAATELREITDQRGNFRIDDLPPGEYRALAWVSIPEFAHRNADFLERYRAQGVVVRVEEGGTSMVRLSVIPE